MEFVLQLCKKDTHFSPNEHFLLHFHKGQEKLFWWMFLCAQKKLFKYQKILKKTKYFDSYSHLCVRTGQLQ